MSSKEKEKKKELELENSLKSYIKKPTKIKAIRWTGDNLSEIQYFCGDRCVYKNKKLYIINNGEGCECKVELNDYIFVEFEKSSELKVISQNNLIDFYEEFSNEFGLAGLLWGSLVVTPIELQKFLDEKGLDLVLELEKIQRKIDDESSKSDIKDESSKEVVSDEPTEIKEEISFEFESITGLSDEEDESVNQPPIKEEMFTKDYNISKHAFLNALEEEMSDLKERDYSSKEDSNGFKKEMSDLEDRRKYWDAKKKMLFPYIINIKNLTDEKLYDVDILNIKHEKQNKVSYSCSTGVDYDWFLMSILSQNKPKEEVMRLRLFSICDYPKFRDKQSRCCLQVINQKIDGSISSSPIHSSVYFSPYQMQSGIIDIDIHNEMNRIKLFNQLQLRLSYLMPETEVVITIFPCEIND